MKVSGKGYVYALLSGALFGIIPILVLNISQDGSISNSFCIMVRSFIAGIVLLPVACSRIRNQPLSKEKIRDIAFSGLAMASTSILLFTSYQHIPSGIGVTLHYTYPMVVLILSTLLFHVHIGIKTVIAMLISLIGIVMLCDASTLEGNVLLGVSLALSSSLTFAIYLLWNERRKLAMLDSIVFVSLMSLFDTGDMFIYNLVSNQLDIKFSANVALILLLVGFVGIGAILTQILAIKYVGSVRTSILGTLEPIVCTIGSALVLHDAISFRTILGGALVLGAVILVTLNKKQ